MAEEKELILLIEDEQQMRRFLRITLQSQGYRLVEAATGTEGLSQAASRNPDIVLLDLGLPDMDGLEVTNRLREWTQTPIVIISAREQEQDKVKALDAGADDYLTKPFNSNELLATDTGRCPPLSPQQVRSIRTCFYDRQSSGRSFPTAGASSMTKKYISLP